MRAARAGAVALVVAALASGCGGERSTPTVATVVQDDAELLHRSPRQVAATLDDMRSLGVDWVRVTAGWSVMAPDPRAHRRPAFDASDPTKYPPLVWSRLDRVYTMARARGMKVAIDIAFWAPRWAVARAAGRSERPRDSIDPSAYADFAEATARRYPRAVAFTVWNEPNHPVFLLPQWERKDDAWRPASPHLYRAMVQAAVPRIKAAAPNALVLIGATSSVGAETGHDRGDRMAPLTFLREMACVDEQLQPLRGPECDGFEPLPGDGWSHHPYSLELTPSQADPSSDNVRMGDLSRLTDLLHRLHAAGRTVKPLTLYLTESGYQTNPPDPTWRVSLEDQARWLIEGERVARSQPQVRSVAQFLVRDMPVRDGHDLATRWGDYQSGLRFADGRPKPARAAFALGLVARRQGADSVAFWGLVRPGDGRRDARVTVREPDGSWRTLADQQTSDDGTFEVSVDIDPARTFRLESGRSTGPPVVGAR
jgi:hypothetical protein